MLRTLTAALTGAALIPAFAVGAGAQSYGAQSHYGSSHANSAYERCVREQRGRQVTGAVIGGLLGAVIGAEIHDDRQDRDRARHHYRGDRHSYRGRGYRDRDRRHRRHHRRDRHYHEEGNDGAVLAGAGLGALAGAAVAGSGRGGCERFLHDGARYGHGGQYNQSRDYAYAQQSYDDDWRYDGPAQYSYDSEYEDYGSSSEVLLGGEDYGRSSRSYSAQSSVQTISTGPCRSMRSGNGAQVWMCQGADGIWRPA